MKDFLKSVLASALGTFIAGMATCALVVIAVVALVSSAGNRPEVAQAVVKPKTVLVVGNDLSINDTPAFGTPGLSDLFGGGAGPTLDLLRALEAVDLAAKDKNIVGLLLSGHLQAGLVQKAELRQAIVEFKKTGKPVIAWIENGSQGEFYMASIADKIYIHPAGEVEFKGLASFNTYYGETFKRFGVGVQVTKVGKYKSAVEPFLGDRMSEPAREQEELLLGNIWKRVIADVASARKLSQAALIRAANTGGVFNAEKALSLKLVDGVLQRDELIERMRKAGAGPDESNTSFRQVSLHKYAHKVKFPQGGGRVAVVYAEGEIVDGWGSPEDVGGDRLARDLRFLRGDDNVKAIVLRVNSPGGSAFASDIVAREVSLLRAKGLPVVVSMGDVAASGGYYIAAKGSVIMADPSTITGSIGVFGLHFNYEELAKKISLGTDGVKTARYADLLEMHRAASPEELAVIQIMVDGVYEDFLKIVAEGRKMNRDDVHEIAQGRVWIGSMAKDIKLVDRFGGLRDAIKLAAQMAKLNSVEIIQVPSLHSGRENLLQKILSNDDPESPLFAKTSGKDPALLFLRSHLEILRSLRALNDPRGVYLSCPAKPIR
ncbi:MAG: signal peptide peptidase SppA [Verrucomicrobiota bacterium]